MWCTCPMMVTHPSTNRAQRQMILPLVIWNSIPESIRAVDNVHTFKRLLKSHFVNLLNCYRWKFLRIFANFHELLQTFANCCKFLQTLQHFYFTVAFILFLFYTCGLLYFHWQNGRWTSCVYVQLDQSWPARRVLQRCCHRDPTRC